MTRKIARAAARIAAGMEENVFLGNLDAVRDWGYAREYVEGMWLMLQADTPADYVLATGTATTVREFAEWCFERVGLDWEEHVRFDETYLRPTEVDALIGDASKAETRAGVEGPDPARRPRPPHGRRGDRAPMIALHHEARRRGIRASGHSFEAGCTLRDRSGHGRLRQVSRRTLVRCRNLPHGNRVVVERTLRSKSRSGSVADG